MPLPSDWQVVMAEMVRGAAPADGARFAGGPVLGPSEQIGIYREQYRLRMWDAFVEEIPGLRVLLGDDLERVVWGYLADCPPDSWTLARITNRLPGWLEAHGAPAAHVDMARLDAAV